MKYADRLRLVQPKPVPRYKYGLKPVLAQPTIKLRDYYTSDLPSVDSLKFPFGHADAIQPQMFMNDTLGDCTVAGSIEEIRLACALGGISVNFTDAQALSAYEAIGGYNPDDPSTDQGVDVHDLFAYRKSTGITDADGNAHKVVAYAGLTPGDFNELLVALSLFDMVGLGIQVPDYIQDQFAAGQPWTLEPGDHQIVGGHYIPVVGATDASTAVVYTWGAKQGITAPFYSQYDTVAVVALTEELFKGGKTPEGIDLKSLQADLAKLNTGNVSSKP